MSRALILFGHGERDSFNGRLADSYERGYQAGGGQVERVDLIDLRFDPILRKGYREPQPLEPDLLRLKSSIEAASHLVWVFPTYWAGPPTLVRGLVDRLFLPGWAFRYSKESALPEGLLAGRSGHVIATMDSPWWWYSLVHHRTLHRSFGTGTLSFCGVKPLQFTTIHGVHHMPEPTRAVWCERVEEAARASASKRRAPELVSKTPAL